MPITDRLIVDRMDWNLLRTYRVIVQEQSVSRAALRLHLTQSAISAALRRLEDTVGRTLVHRQGGHFDPTSTGRRIYDMSNHLYDRISQLDAESAGDDHAGEAVAGMIRLPCIGQFGCAAYDAFLADFRRDFPHATLCVEITPPEQVVSAVAQKLATCGITYGATVPDALDRLLLMRERYALCCGRRHALFGVTEVAPDALRKADLAVCSGTSAGTPLQPFDLLRRPFGLDGKIVARSDNRDEVKRLVIAGYGIGFLPAHAISSEIENGQLWKLSTEIDHPDLAIHLIWNNKKRLNPAEHAFIDSLMRRTGHWPHSACQSEADTTGRQPNLQ
jgi:DNA-binding transcriptional LysR family regulator